MIKVELGHIETSGPKFIIMAELATLFNNFNRQGDFTKEEIQQIVNDGFLTDEELDAKFTENCKKSGQSVEDAMAEAVVVSLLSSLL